MTSEKRSWYEGATYHITARGHHRNDIFREHSAPRPGHTAAQVPGASPLLPYIHSPPQHGR